MPAEALKEKPYRTLKAESCDEFIEKRSRFIGYARPVKTEEEALEFIKQMKARHWDAAHNVYAYSLRQGQIRRFSDDGEPQGTAGIPVLEVLTKRQITDAVVVVTRYFGGILLGAGGLVRAYSHGAGLGVEASGIVTMAPCVTASLQCAYDQYGRVSALIPSCGGVIDDTVFEEAVSIRFHILPRLLGGFEKDLADATCGRVEINIEGEEFFSFSEGETADM